MGRATTTFITPIIHAEDPSLFLDLQFQRDGAYSARRGPLPTFTRASAAWRVNSAGVIVPAAVNEARIDYNPTTLEASGLLIEEQRTNLATYSADLTNADWSKAATTATADQTLSPDGTVNADLLAETTANAQHTTANSSSVSAVSGTTYTQSVFLKKGTGATAPDWVVLALYSSAFGSTAVAFNVTTGAVGSTTGSPAVVVTQFSNGWWRVAITKTATASATIGAAYIAFTNNANTTSVPTYVGQTTSNVFVWGAQFEAGAFATSYIPTTTATVIRSADVCSITGGAFSGFWNATEGTIVFKGIKSALQPAVTPSYMGVDDGGSTNRIILFGGSAETVFVSTSSTIQANLGGVTQVAANTPFGMAVRYKSNDFALSLNGGTVLSDVSGTVPSVTQMLIGQRLSSNFMGGWIQSVQIYDRIKADAKLQALSTP